MTIAWMMYAFGIGVLLTVAAVSAEWALKSAQRSVRFVWVGAIALTLAFTLLAPIRAPGPQATVGLSALPVTESPAVVAIQPTLFEKIVADSRAALDLLMMPVQQVLEAAKATSQRANVGAGVVWLLSAIVALFVLLAVYFRSMRESSRWPRTSVLGRNVRVAPNVGPAVMGIAPPQIVIPQWVLLRKPDEQRLVLEHESEHVRAHDPLLLVFACVAVVLMPWNAAVWYMWSRLRLAVELDCDQRVLRRGVAKPAYGELLVELSSQRPWNSLAMPAFSWGTSHLEKRLVAMTARPVRFSTARRIASAGVIAVVLVAACNSEMPTAAQVAEMDVSTLASRVPLTDSVIYIVNGRTVTKKFAKAIVPEDISGIEVQRASKNNPVAKIHVTLVDDSSRKLRDVSIDINAAKNEEAADRTPRVTIQGDSVTLLLRPTRDMSLVMPDNGAAVKPESRLIRNGNSMTLVTDSGRAEITGKNLVLRAPACGPEGVVSATARGTFHGQISNRDDQQSPLCRGTPLFIIDGVVMASGFDLASINQDRIESVEVLKGIAAGKIYGPRAVDGVIAITLKK